jgi:glucose-1-phosphate thymidylyltransferase
MANRKGLLLAGGSGTRLMPLTSSVNKHLLPIYDKPMIFYSLSILMLSGIDDILIITRNEDVNLFKNLLGNGENFGIKLDYAIQDNPNGIAEAFRIGEKFIGKSEVALMLGDNIFYGGQLSVKLASAMNRKKGASIFAYEVIDPSRFGVVSFDENMKINSIEEKPLKPKSNYAVTGLYFYDNRVIDYAKEVKPSKRGELEITSINEMYLNEESLYVEIMGRGFTWLDTGTFDSLVEASNFISIMQRQQGFNIACLEEIAYNNNWITKDKLLELVRHKNSPYHNYIKDLISK